MWYRWVLCGTVGYCVVQVGILWYRWKGTGTYCVVQGVIVSVMSIIQGLGGRRGGCVSVWYRWVLCTTYSAVSTGGCDVHGTGGYCALLTQL